MTLNQIENCRKDKGWDLSNKVLYDLCTQHFSHDTTEEILAKTLLIGRAYAAAIERRKTKNKNEINDNFYIDIVAPALKKSNLDESLLHLKSYSQISLENLPHIINAHSLLTSTLFEITKLEKRSFSSKYLHFHLPQLFFIYDSRAVSAMRLFIKSLPKELKELSDKNNVDKQYSTFAYKCFFIRDKIYKQYQILLSPRELDNLLMEIANNKSLNLKN